MAKGHELRDTLTDAVVNIAISEIPWPNGTKPLPPHLWEAARIKLQARYRRATGEPTATLYADDRSALEAELQAAVKRAEEVEAERDRLDRCLALADKRAGESDTIAVNNAFSAAILARENEALKKALEAALNAGRGTSGRIILDIEDEEAIRTALASTSDQTNHTPAERGGVEEADHG